MARTKALISLAVTAKLICVFVFAYAKSRFSYDAAHMSPAFVSFLLALICSHLVKTNTIKTAIQNISKKMDRYVFGDNCKIIFVSSSLKPMLWVLIRIASPRQF